MRARICVSILPKTVPEALSLMEKAEVAQVDFIEVRLDRLEDCLGNLDALRDMAAYGKTPKIATDRASRSRTEQRQLLLDAAKSGFEYVDVDLFTSDLNALAKELKALGPKAIISFHKFDGSLSLSELNSILEREIASGADICKIVTTAKQIEDNLTILNFTAAAANRTKLVCFCMGELGKISRLLSPLFGGFFTFAALEKGSETAAGQMSISEMKAAYALLGQR
ncbi:MAG: type I 3-dehydroquinate dehydratase [Candidatus Bathyarchaeia archaeon]